MKRILFATTALVGGAMLFGDYAAAQTVTVSGRVRAEIGFGGEGTTLSHTDGGATTTYELPKFSMRTSKADIGASLSGVADSGLEYSATVRYKGGSGDVATDTANLSIGSPTLGKLSLGHTNGADGLVNSGGMSVQSGTGGLDGITGAWVSGAAKGIMGLTGATNEGGDANGITYTSPSLSGLQVAVSYKPSAALDWSTVPSAVTVANVGGYSNIIGGAVKYVNTISNVGLDVGAAFTFAQSGLADAVGASAYKRGNAIGLKTGLKATLDQFSAGLGFQFGQNKKEDNDNNRQDYMTVTAGVAYNYGPGTVSLGGAFSQVTNYTDGGVKYNQNDSSFAGNLSASYSLAPGVTLQADAVFYSKDAGLAAAPSNTNPDNEAVTDFGVSLAVNVAF